MVCVGGSGRTAVANRRPAVAPLADEDHECVDCGLSYAQVDVETAIESIGAIPPAVREAVAAIPAGAHRRRPGADTWSIVEYVCHLRDVYAVYTIRLHRASSEDRPVLEPMLNDLRARRFRYNDRDIHAVIAELGANAGGFCAEARRRPRRLGPHGHPTARRAAHSSLAGAASPTRRPVPPG
jgi:hypothetical protein